MQLRTDNGYGTVDIVSGDNTVKGHSLDADWSQVVPGYSWFSFIGESEVPFLIQAKRSPTENVSGVWEIDLDANYSGSSKTDFAYVIHKDFTLNRNLPLFAPGDVQRSQIINRAFQILDFLLFEPGVAQQLFAQPLANGQTGAVTFTFTVPRLALSYVPTVIIENIVDANPQNLKWMITGKTLEYFTVALVDYPDSANYVMRAKA